MNGMRVDARELPLHMQEQVAMSFLAQAGNIIPGVRDNDHMAEWAFRNGQKKRSEEIISMMMEVRTKVHGEQYALLTALINQIKIM